MIKISIFAPPPLQILQGGLRQSDFRYNLTGYNGEVTP